MLEEIAEVVNVDENTVTVNVIRQSVCGTCSAQKACGHQLLNKFHPQRQLTLSVSLTGHNSNTVKVGDKIRIGIQDNALIKASLLVYGSPLMGMMIGMLLFHQWMLSGLGAILGLIGGFLYVRHCNEKWQKGKSDQSRSCYQPVFLGVLAEDSHSTKVNFLP